MFHYLELVQGHKDKVDCPVLYTQHRPNEQLDD